MEDDPFLEKTLVQSQSQVLIPEESPQKVSLKLPALQNVDLSHSTLINQSKFESLSARFGISSDLPLKSGNTESFSFEIIEFLGQGSHGKAFLAKDLKQDGREVALKFLDFSSFSDQCYLNSVRELIVMQILASTRIPPSSYFLELYDFYLEDSDKDRGKLALVIVMEFSLMDFSELLAIRRDLGLKLDEDELLYVLESLVKGLWQLRKLNIAHRDVKLDNIFLSKDFGVKIGDFSEAKLFESGTENSFMKSSIKGSPFFMSPEMKSAYKANEAKICYDPWKSDLYSLGLALLQLRMFVPLSSIPESQFTCLNSSSPFDSILIKMLEKDPENRISLEAVLESLLLVEKRILLGKVSFARKCDEAYTVRRSRIIGKSDDFIEFLTRRLSVSEVYSRVFEFSKAIEESLQILQYIGSLKSLQKPWEAEFGARIDLLQAKVYENLGNIYKRTLQYEPSLFNFQEAVRLLVGRMEGGRGEQEGLREDLVRTSISLASMMRHAGRVDEVLELVGAIQQELSGYLIKALNEFFERGKNERLRQIYRNFSEVYEIFAGLLRSRGDSISARAFLVNSLDLLELSGANDVAKLTLYAVLAETLIESGHLEEARFILEKNLEDSRKKGFFNENSGFCLFLLSKIYYEDNDFEISEALLAQSEDVYMRVFRGMRNEKRFVEVYKLKARIAKKRGFLDKSLEFIEKALEITQKIDDLPSSIVLKAKRASVFRLKLDEKAELLEIESIYEVLHLKRLNISRNGGFEGRIMQRLGQLYKKAGELEKSTIFYQEALEKCKGIRKAEILTDLCLNLMSLKGIEVTKRREKIAEYYTEALGLDEFHGKSENMKIIQCFLREK